MQYSDLSSQNGSLALTGEYTPNGVRMYCPKRRLKTKHIVHFEWPSTFDINDFLSGAFLMLHVHVTLSDLYYEGNQFESPRSSVIFLGTAKIMGRNLKIGRYSLL